MAPFSGRDSTVRMSTTAIVGQGNWSLEGVNVDQIDTTAFGSVWKTYEAGMLDGGTISFSGYFDPSDASGQAAIIAANIAGTHLLGDTGLRFYYSATSYYYAATTNPVSFVLITGYTIKADKSDVARIDFSGKVSGKLVTN